MNMTEVKLERDPFTGEAMYRLTAVRQDASDRDAEEMRAAAESGEPEAMCRLAEALYDRGDPESIQWFRRAAEAGDGYSCWCLASCLLFGDGTDRDPGEAVTWLLKAAGSYYIPVFYDLGVCARIGLGTPTDGEAAVRWFNWASAGLTGRPRYGTRWRLRRDTCWHSTRWRCSTRRAAWRGRTGRP